MNDQIAIMETMSVKDSGFALFRRGRVIEGSAAVGDKIISGFTLESADISSDWNINKLEVVAFLYNNTTKQVVQATKMKL